MYITRMGIRIDYVAEGLSDYRDELIDAVLPGLVAVIASQEPMWVREARAAWAQDRDYGWSEDWY